MILIYSAQLLKGESFWCIAPISEKQYSYKTLKVSKKKLLFKK